MRDSRLLRRSKNTNVGSKKSRRSHVDYQALEPRNLLATINGTDLPEVITVSTETIQFPFDFEDRRDTTVVWDGSSTYDDSDFVHTFSAAYDTVLGTQGDISIDYSADSPVIFQQGIPGSLADPIPPEANFIAGPLMDGETVTIRFTESVEDLVLPIFDFDEDVGSTLTVTTDGSPMVTYTGPTENTFDGIQLSRDSGPFDIPDHLSHLQNVSTLRFESLASDGITEVSLTFSSSILGSGTIGIGSPTVSDIELISGSIDVSQLVVSIQAFENASYAIPVGMPTRFVVIYDTPDETLTGPADTMVFIDARESGDRVEIVGDVAGSRPATYELFISGGDGFDTIYREAPGVGSDWTFFTQNNLLEDSEFFDIGFDQFEIAEGGDADDTFVVEEDVEIQIRAGGGNDSVTVDSDLIGDVVTGGGNDSITVDAFLAGDIYGGEGDDTVTVNSDLDGGIFGEEGDDLFEFVAGEVSFGAFGGQGDDRFIFQGGFAAFRVIGGSGVDTVDFSDRSDRLIAMVFGSDQDGYDVFALESGPGNMNMNGIDSILAPANSDNRIFGQDQNATWELDSPVSLDTFDKEIWSYDYTPEGLTNSLSFTGFNVLVGGRQSDRFEIDGITTVGNTRLYVNGRVGDDNYVVRTTGDASDYLENIVVNETGGSNSFSVEHLGTDGLFYSLLNNALVGFIPSTIIYFGEFADFDINGTDANDVAIVLSSASNIPYQLNGNGGNDLFFVGSSLVKGDGSLENIEGTINISGGSLGIPNGTDRVIVVDQGTVGARDYRLTDSSVSYVDLPGSAFGSLTFDDVFAVRLEGTDSQNTFFVTPSSSTRLIVHGNGPDRVANPLDGDSVQIEDPGTSTSRQVFQDGGIGSGFFAFSNPTFAPVLFEGIERFIPARFVMAADEAANDFPIFRVFNENMEQVYERLAYEPGFSGGVRVAVGDFNADGISDVVTVPGPGRAPTIRIFDGLDGQLLSSFDAYPAGWQSGLNVAVGDVIGDSDLEIIVVPAEGRPLVRVITAEGLIQSQFEAYTEDVGASVAVGDVDGDRNNEIVTGSGAGRASQVAVFHPEISGNASSRFLPFGASFSDGVNVAVGEFGSNIRGSFEYEVVVSPMETLVANVQSKVLVFDGADVSELFGAPLVPIHEFDVFVDQTQRISAVRVALKDFDVDGVIDSIFVAYGNGDQARRADVHLPFGTAVFDSLFESEFVFGDGYFVA